MSNSRFDIETIERYLFDQMSESEKVEFQFQLLQDKELQIEVKKMRQIQKTLIAEKKMEKGSLSFFKWKWFIPLILILATGVYFASQSLFQPSQSPLKEEELTVPDESDKVSQQTEAPEEKLDGQENQAPPNIEDTPTETLKPAKQAAPPIAAADPKAFNPNPYLEEFIEGVRNPELRLEIDSPGADLTFPLISGEADINILGKIYGNPPPTLQLSIFDNREASYEAYQPLLIRSMPLNKEQEYFAFRFSEKRQMKAGLYYYIIETEEEEEILHIGKFFVR